ncbi:Thg1 C terminal domain-containing protein [Scheffersomyces xylosifermentans]|uniref:Thg1 C terminal domain-containing protein n=1 Tax=Scheffersomyces xylosifermentans TaxID=1304137 RepID=UPI00315DCE76
MANSRFEYVKQFEREHHLLPDTYIVIRVDGKGFHKFSEEYKFDKPNDLRALQVMNRAAQAVMSQFSDVLMAYGDSDEYSFLLRKQCSLYERREMKLITMFASSISTNYYYYWNEEFPEKPLKQSRLPNFDARAVTYPNFSLIRDYFSWRQVDCHINNLYNTTFWTLVSKGGMTPKEAENKLIGTVASDKNEILFSQFGINYNNEPEIFKKGTILMREMTQEESEVNESELSSRQKQRIEKKRKKAEIKTYHEDLITNENFWTSRPWLSL